MRRADRLFDIIRILGAADKPVTAAALAAELEVTARTIYRDIAALQASRVPIEGAPGLGYVMGRGFSMPPLMFTVGEVEAIMVGARLARRTGDQSLVKLADRVLSKVAAILPNELRDLVAVPPVYVSDHNEQISHDIDLSEIRRAILETRKLRIAYVDGKEIHSARTIWPIALAYYVDVILVGAWCELRLDFRHFRIDRISSVVMLDECYPAEGKQLTADWLALDRYPSRPDRSGTHA